MKRKLIIVEGIDRVGKTTLVNKLVDELGYKKYVQLGNIERFNNFRKIQNKEIIRLAETRVIYSTLSVINSLIDKDINLVIDRFHLSELVYGAVERDYLNYEMFEVDKLLAKLKAVLIYVKPTDIVKSSEEHGAYLYDHYALYEDVMTQTHIDSIRCNYDTLDEVVELIRGGY